MIDEKIERVVKESKDLDKFNTKVKKVLNDSGYCYEGCYVNRRRGEVGVRYENGKDAVMGIAKCSPSDVFIPVVGLAIANSRALKRVKGEDYEVE